MTISENVLQVEVGKYRVTEVYRPIAQALVDKYDELSHIEVNRILFVENLESTGVSRGKPRLACTRKVPELWFEIVRQLTGRKFDYIIEFFRVNTLGLSKAQLVATIYHELRHISAEGKLIAHDVEDWSNLVAALGQNWYMPETEIPDLLSDDIEWDRLRGATLPGMGNE